MTNKKLKLELLSELLSSLDKQENELDNAFGLARDLACSSWTEGLVPSRMGGRLEPIPNIMHPERMDLLQRNTKMLRLKFHEKREAIKELMRLVNE